MFTKTEDSSTQKTKTIENSNDTAAQADDRKSLNSSQNMRPQSLRDGLTTGLLDSET